MLMSTSEALSSPPQKTTTKPVFESATNTREHGHQEGQGFQRNDRRKYGNIDKCFFFLVMEPQEALIPAALTLSTKGSDCVNCLEAQIQNAKLTKELEDANSKRKKLMGSMAKAAQEYETKIAELERDADVSKKARDEALQDKETTVRRVLLLLFFLSFFPVRKFFALSSLTRPRPPLPTKFPR